ncbi:hypothetical protein BDN70DRAFT_989416 [Pholiota conissans]|uniref:Uncharacterized protein n=1 Tax=Pholiota conissans TaxID=109636 RepID=A0A9P5ZBN9_9AGAR|nr:hypothetical protein BDN70DRAFT_989416 [Pholiota conissans]
MSAMLDTYDMQMLDYSGDHDVQMNPSSLDPWFQDEAKMEEDGPASKHESEGSSKIDTQIQEKVDATIEVDMEPSMELHNTEYDMLDAEEAHNSEIPDIEVYDASHILSPAMFAVASAEGETFREIFDTSIVRSTLDEATNVIPVESSNSLLETHPIASKETPSAPHVFPQSYIHESEPKKQPAINVNALESAPDTIEAAHEPSSEFHTTEFREPSPEDTENSVPDDGHPTVGSSTQDYLPAVDKVPAHPQIDNNVESDNAQLINIHDANAPGTVSGDNVSSGDPHEISEGVYIDPPPPVLLSLGADEGFDFSLFNEPSWNEGIQQDVEVKRIEHIFLHHLPTLYYEPLFTVFEALRHEEFLQSLFSLSEAELILEAVDLQLTLSEDNIYAREVTLHDLNVLHDVSGINGLLRIRLSAISPRFISRYQHLQSQISRLDLGILAEELPAETNGSDLLEDKERQGVSTEPKKLENHGTHEGAERLLHGIDDRSTQEEDSLDRGDYEGQEQAHEPVLNEQLQEHKAEEEATSSQEQTSTKEMSINIPVLMQDNSLSNQQLEYNKDEDDNEAQAEDENELSTPTHHSTPILGTCDLGASVHEDEYADVLALETAESNLHDDSQYTEDKYSFEQRKCEEGVEGPEYDNDEGQEGSGDEEYQAEDQGQYQEQKITEQHQDQQEYEEEEEHEYPEDIHLTQSQEGADLTVGQPTTDDTGQLVPSDAPGTSEPGEQINELLNEQASTIDQDASYEEGEYIDDIDTAYDHSAVIDAPEEFSHIEETEQSPHHAAGPLNSHPEFPEFLGEEWEDDLDGEGEIDDTWDEDNEAETVQSNSNSSSVTLSSKASKRSYDVLELDGDGNEDGNSHETPLGSPGPKRPRTQ